MPISEWTFLSNHSHVLICLARNPEARMRDVADAVGITERAVQRIVQELVEYGVVNRSRVGRRNTYEIHPDKPLRHPVEGNCTVRDLLTTVADVQLLANPDRTSSEDASETDGA